MLAVTYASLGWAQLRHSGKLWGKGYMNRMIKVPATPAGLDAVEDLAAAGLALNVTLIFSERQYKIARERIWKGAQRRKNGGTTY